MSHFAVKGAAMVRIAISACLLGEACRWDGASKPHDAVLKLVTQPGVEVIPLCPEVTGGLPTPRPASEIQPTRRVTTSEGADVTEAFLLGAQRCFRQAEEGRVAFAVLKEGSPSCGSTQIHDGTFSGVRIGGEGITAELFRQHDIVVISEVQLQTLMDEFFAKMADGVDGQHACWDAEEFALWVQKIAQID